ncbi:acyloxyacyl hydrolase [Chryseobacterium sp.]|uniref:acyloxyacyl hydrolase n=1 Tax=Chryseobacterium sp. TaxID=1871047 RepID=UPI00388D05DB
MKQLYLFLCLYSANYLRAQRVDSIPKATWSFSAAVENGAVLPTNDQLKNYEDKSYLGYSLEILKYPNGEKKWQKLYPNTHYGIGIIGYDFLSNKEMGSPFAVFGIYSSDIKNWKRLRWDYKVKFGVSCNSNPYNFDEGYMNSSLGSKTNMYIGLSSGLYYELTNNFNLGFNLKFNHLSNGSLKVPNRGLNTFAPQISLVYYPERPQKSLDAPETEENTSRNKSGSFEISAFVARKNFFYRGEDRHDIKPFEGYNYSVYGVEASYMKQFSAKSAVGLGIGITQDDEYNHTMYIQDHILMQKKRFSNNQVLFSIIPTYRLMIDRLYINIGAGYYAFKKGRKYDETPFFQKIGLQYQFNSRVFASFGINAYQFHVANYLEWKIGYTFPRKSL